MHLWVIGAGGLLGSAVTRMAHATEFATFTSPRIPWADPDGTVETVSEAAQDFRARIEDSEQLNWGIVWAAGRASTASSQEDADRERDVFCRSMEVIARTMNGIPGTFLLASSAGGIYAGGTNPPFTSSSPEAPIGIYGHLKRAQEECATEILGGQHSVVIARIANLYGPGQDLSKLQGLISRIALTSVTKTTMNIFVPLDTIRDYIFCDDAARYLLHWLREAGLTTSSPGPQIRVIASGQPTTVGYVVATMRDIARTQIPIALGMHSSAAAQAHDLRLIPDTSEVLKTIELTPLPSGMKAVYLDVLARHQSAVH